MTSCFGDECVCDPTADPSCPVTIFLKIIYLIFKKDLELKAVDDLISDDSGSEGNGGIRDDSNYGNEGRKNTG